MNENQFENFIYCCLSFACNAHFDEERYINNFIKGNLGGKTFCETIINNYKIAHNMHFGVCFTFSCWAYHLLHTIGFDSGYYLVETVEKGTGYPNTVLMYLYNGNYYICDLAEQVARCEEAIKRLFLISKYPDNYSEGEKNETLAILNDRKYISCSLEEYEKEYNLGFLHLASGIGDERIFTDIPMISVKEFLKEQEIGSRK